MAIINGLEWTFDTVTELYEKIRPGYVDELYNMIFEYVPISESSKVIEIGIGSGQATLPVLKTGCKLTAIECGEQFTKLCEEKFKDYPNFSIITNKFENVEFHYSTYDLVYSASAFHWIPEEIGYSKVFSILKNGGVFASFTNHPYRDKGNLALANEIDKIYKQYYYKYHNKKEIKLVEYTEEDAKNKAFIAGKYGFSDIKYALFYRTRKFSAKEYIKLLSTYSDHIAIEEKTRIEFFERIEESINKHGGEITIYDTIDLQLARKK